jgi:hypothetical protein
MQSRVRSNRCPIPTLAIAAGLAAAATPHAGADYSFQVFAVPGQAIGGSTATVVSPAEPYMAADGTIVFRTGLVVVQGTIGGLLTVTEAPSSALITNPSMTLRTVGAGGHHCSYRTHATSIPVQQWYWYTQHGVQGDVETLQSASLAVPGYPSGTYWSSGTQNVVIGPTGTAIFTDATLDAMFRDEPGVTSSSTALIAKSGVQSNGVTHWSNLTALGANASGVALFKVAQTTGTIASTALRTQSPSLPGTHGIVAGSGSAAPGGGYFANNLNVLQASINDAGQVVFAWRTTGEVGVGDAGLWLSTPGSPLIAVMREGWAAPGTQANFHEPAFTSAVIGGDGAVAFVAQLIGSGVTTTNDTALYIKPAGGPLQLVAREGSSAPGTARSFGSLLSVSLAVTAGGELIFSAPLDQGNAIFRRRTTGVIENILSTGDMVTVASMPRTVSSLSVVPGRSGLQDGRGSWVNQAGQIALKLGFIDGTLALVVGTPAAEPVPCYANCDQSTAAPILNVADFSCFLQTFAAGDSYANCDNSSAAPMLNVADFSCFLQSFAAGCP